MSFREGILEIVPAEGGDPIRIAVDIPVPIPPSRLARRKPPVSEYDQQELRRLSVTRQNLKKQELRFEMIRAYGGCCKCCGENISRFLTMDHVNNDGNIHRAEFPEAKEMARYLKKRGWPQEGFQLLCYNCNMGKHLNKGVCPHEENKGSYYA